MSPAAPPVSDAAAWLSDHGDALFAYALRRTRDRAVAEELVQETLVVAVSTPERFQGRSAVRTWLFGILRHKILDHWRARARAPVSLDEELRPEVDRLFRASGKWTAEASPRRWRVAEVPSATERGELQAALRECLAALPPRAAEAFVLRECHDVSVEQLSQELGTTATNVWQILSRARTALRACLEGRITGAPRTGASRRTAEADRARSVG